MILLRNSTRFRRATTVGSILWTAPLLLAITSPAWSQLPLEPITRGTIAWHVARAKAQGVTNVKLGTWVGIPPDTSTLDDALQAYTAVIFQPLVSRTYVENNTHLMTWYKVHVLQVLSQPPSSRIESFTWTNLPPDLAPTDLLPLATGELLLVCFGGTTTIDGITVTTDNKHLPPLSTMTRYLAFISLNPDGQTATVPLEDAGLFPITGDSLRGGTHVHALTADITERHQGLLSTVQAHIRSVFGRR